MRECLWSAKFLSVNKSPQKFLCVNKSPLKVFVCSAQICAGRLFSHGSSNFSHFMWLLNFSTFTTSPAGLAIVASHWPSKGGELHTTKPLCLYIFFGCIFSAQLWLMRGEGGWVGYRYSQNPESFFYRPNLIKKPFQLFAGPKRALALCGQVSWYLVWGEVGFTIEHCATSFECFGGM